MTTRVLVAGAPLPNVLDRTYCRIAAQERNQAVSRRHNEHNR